MSSPMSAYQIGNDFVARDVLSGIMDNHENEDDKAPYVYLYMADKTHVFEGSLIDLRGGTVLLKVGVSVQFVDVDRVVAVSLRTQS